MRSSHCDSVVMNPASIHEDMGRSLAPLSGLRIWHCLELWCRSQMQLGSGIAVALAWAGSYNSNLSPSLGTSYAAGVALEKTKKDPPPKKKERTRKIIKHLIFTEKLVRFFHL